ncbi:aminoacyl--tRNA ligase-related protein [Halobacterium wangiae]|uniref:aminoacyl--tRNA ligase-related protein n=1 Tax=Halobacterium wangiae TaxID=2902623 RepID=UPI001E6422D9|nr:aminoacyl--tRNA ligase-related protein [Halobacterium wangiae]
MRRSEAFLPTSRETVGAGSDAAKLLVRAGLVRPFGSGLWGVSPAGQRVREKLIARIRAGMDAIGGQAVSLPGLQYRERWAQSGRWGSFEGEMFTLENRDGQAMCLAPSHEEGMVHLVDGQVRSHADLPLLLYQVESKFRDDHARNGLVRTKEFTMKDAYSFHVDETGLDETYREVRAAYDRILADVGLDFAVVSADNSVMGGTASEEFVAPVADGSDRLVYCTVGDCRFGVTDEHDGFAAHDSGGECPDCGGTLAESDGIEVAHVFELGTRYSSAMDLTVDDASGESRDVVMGSYGLGVDRLLQTLVQQHGGETCAWPVTDWGCVAPYRAAVIPVGDGGVQDVAEEIFEACGREDVLFYDDLSVGERFAESDLLGIPAKVVVGNTYREEGVVDLETSEGTRQLAPENVADAVERFAAGATE